MTMQNFFIRLVSTLAPMIHRGIVEKLSNSPTFQKIAWDGTEVAKRAAAEGLRRAKAAGILEDVTPAMRRAQAAADQKKPTTPGPIESFVRKYFT